MADASMNTVLDAVDRAILTELIADARMPMSEVARRAGVSAPTAAERLRKLEAAGVVTGYRAVIDPAALGLTVSAWVRVRPATGQLPRIAELARMTPTITECHRTTGEDCFLMHVHAPTVAALEDVLDSFLLYGQTITAVTVSTPVPPRAVPLARDAE
ncbi:Lrp/AsnC family transcriptional regulator [Humibacter ginsenosidimutans]|uniref:Lrp/AsnC family transcriptional regulator n=1 Tax=Humibacter ginsenosidimutans TaxID=2599293 RepID=A0A5B8M6Q6_9MICO|nr:Lrp/AsnC family transcriptional regulator [Humibacter ginsenosidimutans]QDZ15891.1 Lrp/AsnC family transcriptional regulator [Humibacter ginsenosidimutans]